MGFVILKILKSGFFYLVTNLWI